MLSRTVQVVEEDLTAIGGFSKKVLANSLGVYAVSMLPDFTNANAATIQRNLSRGFAWYLADEVANELLTMNSNFRNFTDISNTDKLWTGVKNAVDDSVFYGLASFGVESTRVDVPVVNTISTFVGNPTISENLGLGLLLTTSQLVAKHLENAGWDAITNVTSKIGF